MSWTYSGDPANSMLDAVRFLIGDTIAADPELQDEEIEFVLLQEANIKYAAAASADRVAARYARKVEKNVGHLRLSMQQKFDQYLRLADRLRAQGGSPPIPFAGGISISDKLNRQLNTDVVQPSISVDTEEMLPNDRTVIPTPGESQ